MSEKRSYPELSQEEKALLWQGFYRGDTKSRTLLLEGNLRLVQAVVSRFAFTVKDREDLIQAGTLGLINAMEHFDFQRGVPFGTYAFPFIKGEVIKALAEMKGQRKGFYRQKLTELSQKDGSFRFSAGNPLSIEELTEAAENIAFADPLAEEEFSAVEERLSLEKAVSRLGYGEKLLLYYRYIAGKSQKEVGNILRLSQTRISRKEKEILAKLREMI